MSLCPDGPLTNSAPTKQSAPLKLLIKGPLPPSFKNNKRSILDRNTGLQRTLTPKETKQRMDILENGIVFALYSLSRTIGAGTHSGCLKQLRTALCELSDDSIREVPAGDWDVRYVPKGEEGLEITIMEYEPPNLTPEEIAQLYSKTLNELKS